MRKRWFTAMLALAAAGCGAGASSRSPNLAGVPLIKGVSIVEHVRRCDRGANPYCAVQLVVVDTHYSSSAALLSSERRYLRSIGWAASAADIGSERAASSPGGKLRLTYATAALDLQAVDLGWIRRSPAIALAIARTMFERQPARAPMLEPGSS